MSGTWGELFGPDPVVVDGGLSTQLTRLGQDISGSLWTGRALLADPRAVEQAHADYVAAGADVVITASYQLSRRGFAEVGLTEREADAAMVASVTAARAAANSSGRTVRVAASVGPYGAILHDGSEVSKIQLDTKAASTEFELFIYLLVTNGSVQMARLLCSLENKDACVMCGS